MAIQEISKEEMEMVSGGLIVLGLDIATIINILVPPRGCWPDWKGLVGVLNNVLTVVANTVTAVGTLVGNVVTSVNNVVIGLGL